MWLILCIPLPFMLLGGYLLYAGVTALRHLSRYRTWPKTPVMVTKGEIKEKTPTPYESYEALIYYEYEVAETVYHNITSIICESSGDAQRVLDQHAEREMLSASYNPANPQEAILETETFNPSFGAMIFIVGGAISFTIGLPLFLVSLFVILMAS